MKRALFIGSLCLGLWTSAAQAADVVIKGSLGETLEGSDNYFLQSTPIGATYKSLSTLHLDVLARTPGWRYLLASNVSFYDYFGPGADSTSPRSSTPVNETFRIDHTTDLARYYFSTNWAHSDVATTQLRETGFANGTGTLDTVHAVGGATHDLSRTDAISWSAQAAHTSFTNAPNQIPFSDVGASVAWSHLLDPRTTLITSVNFDWFNADDIANSERLFWQIMTTLKSQLTRRLTVTASFGTAFANAWQNNPVPTGTTPFVQTGAANSLIAVGLLNYQLLKTTSLTLSGANLIVPTTFGQLQKTTTAGFIVSHGINYWSNIDFGVNFAHTASNTFTAGGADFFSAQVGYSYRLARDWRTRLSYTFRDRQDSGGSAHSNTFLLSLVYDFTLLGNPAAFDPVEAQRALVRQQQAVTQVFPTFQ